MPGYEDYMAELGRQGGNFENLDKSFDGGQLSPSEHFEAMEMENFFTQAKGMPGNKARALSTRIVKDPQAKVQVKEQMRRAGMPTGFQNNPAMPDIHSRLEAQVNFQIKRLTANIALDLPVVLFGPYDLASKYQQIIQQLLPPTVTLTGLDVGKIAGGELFADFVFTAPGPLVDTIRVSCQEYAYPSFLEALKGSKFLMSNGRYSISDTGATGLQQMTKQMQYVSKSMFGKSINDKVPLSASKSPFQFQNGIVDILGTYEVNAERSFTLMIQNVANQEVTIGAFITNADKIGPGI